MLHVFKRVSPQYYIETVASMSSSWPLSSELYEAFYRVSRICNLQ